MAATGALALVADDAEARRRRRHEVAVAGPHLQRLRQPLEQRAARLGRSDRRGPVLPVRRGLDLPAEQAGHQLHAVADPEHRHAGGEHGRVAPRRPGLSHAARSAREDDPGGGAGEDRARRARATARPPNTPTARAAAARSAGCTASRSRGREWSGASRGPLGGYRTGFIARAPRLAHSAGTSSETASHVLYRCGSMRGEVIRRSPRPQDTGVGPRRPFTRLRRGGTVFLTGHVPAGVRPGPGVPRRRDLAAPRGSRPRPSSLHLTTTARTSCCETATCARSTTRRATRGGRHPPPRR